MNITNKTDIREYVRTKKASMKPSEISNYSNIIMNKLICSECYKMYNTIYIYVAFNEEPYTLPIIEDAWSKGKKVAVPKILNGKMDFYYISSRSDLRPGYFGILEPDICSLACDPVVLMIMPGLAFDKRLNRIGYGGGFYDTYLSQHSSKTIYKAALAYDFEVFDFIETEGHDVPIDMIITPKHIYV